MRPASLTSDSRSMRQSRALGARRELHAPEIPGATDVTFGGHVELGPRVRPTLGARRFGRRHRRARTHLLGGRDAQAREPRGHASIRLPLAGRGPRHRALERPRVDRGAPAVGSAAGGDLRLLEAPPEDHELARVEIDRAELERGRRPPGGPALVGAHHAEPLVDVDLGDVTAQRDARTVGLDAPPRRLAEQHERTLDRRVASVGAALRHHAHAFAVLRDHRVASRIAGRRPTLEAKGHGLRGGLAQRRRQVDARTAQVGVDAPARGARAMGEVDAPVGGTGHALQRQAVDVVAERSEIGGARTAHAGGPVAARQRQRVRARRRLRRRCRAR